MSLERTVLIFGGPQDSFGLLDENRQSIFPLEELRRNLDEFITSLKELMPLEEKTGAGMKLNAMTVAVGISGKGKVGFLGTGLEVGGTATLTLTFERS